MTKTTVALGTLGLGATTAIAAPLTLKFSGNNPNEKVTENESAALLSYDVEEGSFPEIEWTGTGIPFTFSKDVSKKYKQIECLKDYFKEGEEWNENRNTIPSISVNATNNNSKGCLVVEYYKQTYGNDKWWGEFKLVWSWMNGKQGFITSFNAKTSNGNLKIDSSLYAVKEEQSKWILDYKQDNEAKIISNKTELINEFPKLSTSIITDSNNYWGFNPELEKICKANECTDTSPSPTKYSSKWSWKEGNGNQGINDWCINLTEWFKELSPNGVWEVIKSSFEVLKGTWTKGN